MMVARDVEHTAQTHVTREKPTTVNHKRFGGGMDGPCVRVFCVARLSQRCTSCVGLYEIFFS